MAPEYAPPQVDASGRARVILHVYDVTNAPSGRVGDVTNKAVAAFNRVAKDALGLGGVFHGGVEVHGLEWSFGLTEGRGVTGVYSVSPGANPMYQYREAVTLGTTSLTHPQVDALIARLQAEWQGHSYELLGRNCVHFCEALSQALGAGPLPPWVNSLAGGAAAAAAAARTAVSKAKDASSKVAGWVQGLGGRQ